MEKKGGLEPGDLDSDGIPEMENRCYYLGVHGPRVPKHREPNHQIYSKAGEF